LQVFADSSWAVQPSLLLAGGQYLDISQQLSYTLLAMPNSCQQPLRAFPSGCWLKHCNFHPVSLKGRISVKNYKKSKEHLKSFETTSSTSFSTDLSNNITFSQSQSHATVSLSM
jgi:hypothetical protein